MLASSLASRLAPGRMLYLAALLAAPWPAVAADTLPTTQDPRLEPVAKSDRVWNAVTTTPDGRVFVGFPASDDPGLQLAELTKDGNLKPYPDAAWNDWRPGEPVGSAFVCANANRLGPDGALWVVDAGAQGVGKPAVPGGARLVRIDLSTDTVSRVIPLDGLTKSVSYIDDVRFNGPHAYLTDAGAPGLIVLDLASGKGRRLLDDDPAMVDARPMLADGKLLLAEDGRELRIHADQLEVSPDGQWLYVQPASGPMARIATRWLDDASLPAPSLATHVERNWADTPTSGGTAIDATGTIYYSDTDRRRILTVSPDGSIATLIADPRLIWVDAMWIDDAGYLWLPANQQNLTKGFTGGKDEVRYPVWIYKMKIDAKPAPNDHG